MKPDQQQASILKVSSPKPIRLEVDGIDDPIWVRIQTAYDQSVGRKKLEALKKDDDCEMGRLLALIICREDGSPMFDVNSEESVMALAKLPAYVQNEILDASNTANKGPKK